MTAYAGLLEEMENAAAFEPVTASAVVNDLNDRVAAGWAKALPLEERLAAKYEQAGRGLARRARRRYERAQPVIAAARPPNWLPEPDELVAPEDAAAGAARTQAQRRAIVQAMVGSILGVEASRDAVFRALIEAQAGRQAERLVEGSRDAVARVILDAQVEGWGVPETAEAIQAELEAVSRWQSVMLARTDLISLSNAASVTSASLLGADAPRYKRWLATNDDRTRPDHRDAHGQLVPLEQSFTVGGEALAYPGDPQGSDAQTIQCRCTTVYQFGEATQAFPEFSFANPGFGPTPISAAFSPSQPRYQVGVREGGRWRPESGEGTLDDLSARHPDVEVWASDYGDGITLHMIRTKPGARGTGAASRALRDLTAMADRRGVPMWLTPEAVGDDAPMSTDQLARWYRRHGWRNTSSRKIGDLEHTGLMIREPTRSLVAAYVEQQHPRDPGGEGGGRWIPKDETAADDYHGIHRAPGREDGAPLYDLANEENGIYPDDVYGPNAARFYGHGGDAVAMDRETVRMIQSLRGKPDAVVTAYRAVPPDVGEINPGDWVTINKAYAEQHMAGEEGWRILEKKVRADELFTDGNSIHEFGYDPGERRDPAVTAATVTEEDEMAELTAAERDWLAQECISLVNRARQLKLTESDDVVTASAEPGFPEGTAYVEQGGTIFNLTAPVEPGDYVIKHDHVTGSTSFVPVWDATGMYVGGEREGLVAAAPVAPPEEWFQDPGLTEPTPLTVTPEGRVFGHLAQWGRCHTGIGGRCVIAPRSQTGYEAFHTGSVLTDSGKQVRIGKITARGPHADLNMSGMQAASHYDHSAMSAAYVRAGEDEHGPWLAGAVRSDATPEQIAELRAHPPSGDWRQVGPGGALELVAALAVPVPGFPVAAIAASGAHEGEVTALIMGFDDRQPLALAASCGCDELEQLLDDGALAGLPERDVRLRSQRAV